MRDSHPVPAASLPPSVHMHHSPGQLPRLEIASRLATAQLYLHGAHLTAWHPAHAAAPVLWLSGHSNFLPDRPIRGGVPLCFPWFGPHATDKGAPAHGFARLTSWTLTEAGEAADGTVTLALSLQGDAVSPPWPHRFRATHRISIGSELTMALEVENTGSTAVEFEEALHTYVAVRHVAEITIDGLDNTEYLDKTAQMSRRRQGDAPITFAGETDRTYLDTAAACAIHDPGMRRRIVVSKSGSRSTVVWNPWIDKARAMPDFGDHEWPAMVCVETANVGDAAIVLAPGGTHCMTAGLRVERL